MAARDHLGAQFGDYTLKVVPGSSGMKASGYVAATHPDATDGAVGTLSWKAGRVDEVLVDPEHQHQGLATAMYHQATRANRKPLSHSAYRTDAGDAWARTVGGAMPPRREPGH